MQQEQPFKNFFSGLFLFCFFLSLLFVFIFADTKLQKAKIFVVKSDLGKIDINNLGWVEQKSEERYTKRDSFYIFPFKEKLYLLGGINGDNNIIGHHKVDYERSPHYNDIWESTDGVSWKKVVEEAEFPKIRSTVVVQSGEDLIMLGGWSPDTGYDIGVWKSKDAIHFEKVKKTPEFGEREGHRIITHEGKFYLFGGVNYISGKTFNDVWVSKNGEDWKLLVKNASWEPRWDHDVVFFNNRFLLTSGMGLGGLGYGDIWESPDALSWTKTSTSTPWGKMQGQALLEYNDNLWFIGGLNPDTDLGMGDTWKSLDGVNWEKLPYDGAWSGREDHASFVWKNKIFITGGMDGFWRWNNDVWTLEDLPCGKNEVTKIKNIKDLDLTSKNWGLFCLGKNNEPFFLGGKNPTDEVGIASITKLVTAMVAEDFLEETASVEILQADMILGTRARFKDKDSIPKKEALASLLIESENDVAQAIGRMVGETFFTKMNKKARDAGAVYSNFRDPAGIDFGISPSNTSTVVDVAQIVSHTFKNYRNVFNLTKISEKEISGVFGLNHTASATNALLRDAEVSDVILGGKTGETSVAKKNLTLVFQNKENQKFVSVVLGSNDHFADTKRLILEVLK